MDLNQFNALFLRVIDFYFSDLAFLSPGSGGPPLTFNCSLLAHLRFKPYGSGFVLRDHSIENVDGARFLRLYGDDGFFIRILIEEGEIELVDEDLDVTEPVQYLKDKMMTG